MSQGFWLLGVIAAFALIALLVRESRRLLVLRVERGEIVAARGRAPAELFNDLGDALKRARATCHVVLVLREGRVAVDVSGSASDALRQQLRNVVGRFPVARLRTARPVRR